MPRLVFLMILTLTTFAGHVHAQSDQQLVDRYDRMYAAEKYELALRAAEMIVERYPESAIWQFNAGAINSKLNRLDEAIVHLQKCVSLKYSGVRTFEENIDLDPLRDRDEFKVILEQVRSNAKGRMDEFQREARAHVPESYVPSVVSDESRPLVIALHGTGMDGDSMLKAMQDTAKEKQLILICPDALRPAGDGFSWTYRDEAEWFVNHLIDNAVREHNADPEQVILVGFSQGANIALIMAQTQPDRFIGVVPICGHYESQIARASTVPAPTYLMTGARDPWKRTYSDAQRDFMDAGGRVVLRVLSGRGHVLPTGSSGKREYSRAVQWVLDQYP